MARVNSAKRIEREEMRSIRANLRKLAADCRPIEYRYLAVQANRVSNMFAEQTFGKTNVRYARLRRLTKLFQQAYRDRLEGKRANLNEVESIFIAVLGDDSLDYPTKTNKRKAELKIREVMINNVKCITLE